MSEASGEDFETRAFNVRCPNCRLPIELLPDSELSSIDCPSCGSNFSLVNDENATRDALSVKELGQFKLIERLGAGAFGTVWKAYDTELDRTVAVKIPRRGQLEPQQEEQFFREARSAAQLSHSHIVSVYEVGRQGETIYIVSDFIRGVSLAEMIAESQLTQREVVEMGIKLADALHHAHERGVVHRDIKPQNVMIDDAGEPHLMDFGLAKRDAGEVTMTLDGAVLGTPAYMSPEQARGESHRVDRTTDVYSLGVLLFQMLTGELPFRGTTRMLLHKVINNDAPGLRQFNSSISRDLETIILKCLEKEPDGRYPSAEAVGCELDRFLAGKPILARPISRAGKTWRWAKRNHEVAILYTALVVGSIVAAVTFFVRSEKFEAQKNIANEHVKKASTALFNFGVSEYEDRRIENGVAQLIEAWELSEQDELLRKSYGQVLADRLTRGGRYEHTLEGTDQDSLVAFSPDGKQFATATGDLVRLWNAKSCEPQGSVVQGESNVRLMRFTRDGSHVVTVSEGNIIRLVDANTAELAGKPMQNDRRFLAFACSANGAYVAVCCGNKIDVWNSLSGEKAEKSLRHKGKKRSLTLEISSVAINPNATLVATVSTNGVWVWDARTYQEAGDLLRIDSEIAHMTQTVGSWGKVGPGVLAIEFSPDGSTLAATSPNNTVRLWDAESRKPIGEPISHRDRINRLAFSHDGEFLLIGSNETFRLWNARTGEPLDNPVWRKNSIDLLRIHPDDTHIACASGGNIELFELKKGDFVHNIGIYDKSNESIAINPDGTQYATISDAIRLWNMEAAASVSNASNREETADIPALISRLAK